MLLSTTWDALTPAALAEALQDYFTGEVHTTPAFTPTLAAAQAELKQFKLNGYAKTRNHVNGGVSRLNPYITWGVFTLRELQDAVRGTGAGGDYKKFVSELAWKAYFRELFRVLGDRVYRSLEPYKYPAHKQDALPESLAEGTTGIAAIDSIVHELRDTGYLHNHKRLWFAAHLVHYENTEWWHGERLFYRYLLDGEPGPNALSWQWVASTFRSKPYYFNAENMRRYGHVCDAAPFDMSYTALDQRYFSGYGDGGYAKRPSEQPSSNGDWHLPDLVREVGDRPLILLHGERLSERATVLADAPEDAPVLVVLDAARFKREQPSFMRLHWALSLAADVVNTLRLSGRGADLMLFTSSADIVNYARTRGCESFAAPDSWHPDTWTTLAGLGAHMPVAVVPDPPFARVQASLRSFSAYWKKAQKEALRHR